MLRGYPLFVKRDLDGFFGLFIDNLVQLLLIVYLCGSFCGMSGENAAYIFSHILPGAGLSILVGNVFYAWQAHRLAARENRSDVTALPYGINTPSLLVYVFFVMEPVYSRFAGKLGTDAAARLAWQMGLVACLGSGVIELLGAFVAERLRRHTPRAALLSTLAGIAIGFISMTFALQVFQRPLIAMLPLAIILITYFSGTPFPLGLPGGLVAVGLGTLSAWLLTVVGSLAPQAPEWLIGSPMTTQAVVDAWSQTGLRLPLFAGGDLLEVVRGKHGQELLGFISVIVPMGLFNVIGSLQNIESAEAAGDRYPTAPSLAVNGVGTIVAAFFGSCFPTTIYIGHPGWKGLGACAGYSTLNGLVITGICLFGMVGLIKSIVPIEAGIAIVLWIGIVITAQAFQTLPAEHAPAVAVGLFPAIAAWGATVVQGAFIASGGKSIEELLSTNLATDVAGFLVHGMIVMERGYIFTCMILAAVSAFLIDRRFYAAAMWSLAAAILTALGMMHAYEVEGNKVYFLLAFSAPAEGSFHQRATGVAVGYLLLALVFAAFELYHAAGGRMKDEGG